MCFIYTRSNIHMNMVFLFLFSFLLTKTNYHYENEAHENRQRWRNTVTRTKMPSSSHKYNVILFQCCYVIKTEMFAQLILNWCTICLSFFIRSFSCISYKFIRYANVNACLCVRNDHSRTSVLIVCCPHLHSYAIVLFVSSSECLGFDCVYMEMCEIKWTRAFLVARAHMCHVHCIVAHWACWLKRATDHHSAGGKRIAYELFFGCFCETDNMLSVEEGTAHIHTCIGLSHGHLMSMNKRIKNVSHQNQDWNKKLKKILLNGINKLDERDWKR